MSATRKIIIGLVVGILILCLVLYSTTDTDTSSRTVAPSSSTKVILYCPECAEQGIEINLWTNPDRSGVAGSVPHNTQATVLGKETYQGVVHYRVSAGNITGWVSELFIR